MKQQSEEMARLEWGQVGQHRWGRFSEHSPEEGIIRTVPGGVIYTPPPPAAGLRTWRQASASAQRFEMPWVGDPYQVQSLGTLGKDLRGDPPKANDSRLCEICQAVDSLLRCADQLHQKHVSLGLLSPRNVLVVPGTGGMEILLPDLGFVWKGGPVKPDWLKENEFKVLWDSPPEKQQNPQGSSFDEQQLADVRTLGRLLACVLTGIPQREIDNHPPEGAQYQKDNANVLRNLWSTLAAAVRGETKSARELADRLKATPLQGYFFSEPPPPVETAVVPGKPAVDNVVAPGTRIVIKTPGGPKRVLYFALAGGLLLALIALAAWRLWPPGHEGANGGPSNGNASASLFEKYPQAREEEKAAMLVQMGGPDAKPEDQAKVEKLRGEFLVRWKDRLGQAQNEMYTDHRQKFESRKKLETLRDELKLLQDHPATNKTLDGEEKQCLTFAVTLLGQF